MALGLMTYNCSAITDSNTPLHQDVHGLLGRMRTSFDRYHIGFKCPSKNTINTKLAGCYQDVLPGNVLLQTEDKVIPSLDTVHCPTMPHVNHPMPYFEKL